jgi:hypothetical protein
MGVARREFGPGIANPDHRFFSFKKMMRKSLVFHPRAVNESVFSGAPVPFLAAEFFLSHRLKWVEL